MEFVRSFIKVHTIMFLVDFQEAFESSDGENVLEKAKYFGF